MGLVVSICSGSSGSGTTSSINRSATGGGGGAAGLAGGAGGPLAPRGSSGAGKTPPPGFPFAAFGTSSPAWGADFWGAVPTRDPPADARLPGAAPSILGG